MHKIYSGVLAADAERHMRWDLQLFAGEGASSGGDGGDGSSTSGEAAGTDSMESLGIPKEKLEKYRSAKARQAVKPQVEEPAVEPEAPEQDDAAAPEEEKASQAPNWDEAIKNPEFNQRIQDIVQRRVANMRGTIDALTPALETLGQKYGMDVSDVSKPDFISALVEKINSDDSYFENRAEEMGSSPETARKVFQAELAEKRRETSAQEEMLRRHFDDLTRQGEILKQKYPDFDLQRELEDPRFRRMTAPGGGWNVEQAFNAVHHDEIMKAAQEATARQAAQAISNNIQSGKNLPAENGSVQRSAVETQPKLYSQMTPDERRIYKAQLTGKPIGR